jgi:lysophospholipase L1-like esterase
LDNKLATVWVTKADQTEYTVEGLKPGEHLLKVIKRTEALWGVTTFKGVVLKGGGELLKAPDPLPHRIEIVGDSFVCGYGAEATTIKCDDLRPYENVEKAFGALVAKALNAEYHVVAYSGKGVVRNYGDKNQHSPDPFPPLYDRVLCNDEKSSWDFKQWVPNAVIIHLGTNDHSTEPHPDPKDFTHAYVDLLKHIRDKYPKAMIYCFVTSGWPNFSTVVDKVVEKRKSAGDDRVFMVTYPPIDQNDFGCDWHPNAVAHQKLANVLIPVLKEAFDW